MDNKGGLTLCTSYSESIAELVSLLLPSCPVNVYKHCQQNWIMLTNIQKTHAGFRVQNRTLQQPRVSPT